LTCPNFYIIINSMRIFVALALLSSLSCPNTKVINNTHEKWNKYDQSAYNRTEYVCANDERYKYNTPCLKTFIKRKVRVYHAICGFPKKN